MKILFICNQNKNRSKMAEVLFRKKFSTKSAGLYNNTPVNRKQIDWADVIITMEEDQGDEIARRFPVEYLSKRVLCLNIPDVYNYGNSDLKKVLIEKLSNYASLLN